MINIKVGILETSLHIHRHLSRIIFFTLYIKDYLLHSIYQVLSSSFYISKLIFFILLPLTAIMSWMSSPSSGCSTLLVQRIAHSDQESSEVVRLDKLPVEILQRIADFLPCDSAACLILSQKFLSLAIGHRSWFKLRSNRYKREKLKFLITMQRDLEEWILCFQCKMLHAVKENPLSYTKWQNLEERPCSEADGVVELMPNFILRWQHAHMVMKFNKLNSSANTKWLDALSHTLFKFHVPYAHCYARIANENLLSKLEYRILLRHDEDIWQVLDLYPEVCPHWKCMANRNLTRLLQCQWSHGTSHHSCARCSGMIQCRWCATEFTIALVNSTWSSNGRALYITAWRDFGPCQTPFDMRWRTHNVFMTLKFPPPRVPVSFEPDSIRRAFEELGSPKRKWDGLASRSPLDSDVEFAKRIDENSRRATQSEQVCDSRKTIAFLPPLDFGSSPSLKEIMSLQFSLWK